MLKIRTIINHDLVTLEVPGEIPVSEVLRERLGLRGTREACGEGDCGACTIALGALHGNDIVYRAVNSCLLPASRMHRAHLITVEGLAQGTHLHPIQQALLDEHAVQCGFCTPGMVMSLFCLFLNNSSPTPEAVSDALEGTLCRCTGYSSIQRAAAAVQQYMKTPTASSTGLYPAHFLDIPSRLLQIEASPSILHDPQESNDHSTLFFIPFSLSELQENIHQHPDIVLLSGATDIMVNIRVKGQIYRKLADLANIAELRNISVTNTAIRIGAGVTLSALLEHDEIIRRLPVLGEMIGQMCSTQIRNLATLGGNICTASPIADSIPLLLALDASAIMQSPQETRIIPLSKFFTGYRQTALRKGEILAAVEIPLQSRDATFEKTGKRRALDIATVNSAMSVIWDKNRIAQARLALGGVSSIPFMSVRISEFLIGKIINESVINEAATIAASEIQPISDVRGSAEFRKQLTYNHVVKHLTRLSHSFVGGARK